MVYHTQKVLEVPRGCRTYLDGRRFLPAHLEDAHEKLPLQAVVFKLIAFSCCNIL